MFLTDGITIVTPRQEIENICATIPLDNLANIAQAAVVHLTIKCLEAKDKHFEHLL